MYGKEFTPSLIPQPSIAPAEVVMVPSDNLLWKSAVSSRLRYTTLFLDFCHLAAFSFVIVGQGKIRFII